MSRRRDTDSDLRPQPRLPGRQIPDIPPLPDRPDQPEAQITSIKELLELAGRTVSGGKPILDAVAAPGALSPDLRRRLDAQRPARPVTPEQRERLAELARAVGPVEFHVRPATALAPLELPRGGYDVTIALRVRAASEILATLYDEGTLGHEISSALFSLSALRDAFEGVPGGDDIEVGTMHLNPTPSLVVVSDGEVGVLRLPFTLDLDRAPAGEKPATVTTLTGTLQLGVKPDASVGDKLMSVRLRAADLPDGVPLFEIAPSSALQPRSAAALRDFAASFEEDLRPLFDIRLDNVEWSISPTVTLPVGSGVQLRVQRIDTRLRVDDGGGMLLVGVLIGTTDEPEDGTGDPDRLAPPSMPDASDVWARVDEALLYKLVRQSFDTGELQRVVDKAAAERNLKAVVEDAGVEVVPLAIKIRVDVKAIDVCAGFKDVKASVVHEIRLDVLDGRVMVEQSTDIDKDNTDVFWCAVSAILEVFVLELVVLAFFSGRLSYYWGLRPSSGGAPARAFVSGLIDPGIPLPGTEVLPSIEVLQGSITDGGVVTNGDLLLRRDDINTYLYLRVQQLAVGGPEPVMGVRVQVMDQDVPAPSPDDIPPLPRDTETVTKKRSVSVTHELTGAPSEDQELAAGETDMDGNLRLRLSPDQVTTSAGLVVTTKTTERLDIDTGVGGVGHDVSGHFDPHAPVGPGGEPASDQPKSTVRSQSRTPLRERRPDVYFVLTLPDGEVIDTRDMEEGFFPNLRDRHLGTPEEPLTFVLERELPSLPRKAGPS